MKLFFSFTIIFIVTLTIVQCKPSLYYRDYYNINNRFNDDLLQTKDTCGYESCPIPKSNMLNLHLVAHTHDDVGWLKTVDQYYYGSRTQIQKAGVQYIIDSVINALLRDKNKKFIYVETAFLWKWWKEQTDDRRHQVKQLINNGQLEIIGGAWSMNDEAASHYHSIVDQFTWGFRRLNDTFGKCAHPKVGWQIDPFGHSREMASIFAQLGFDGLFIGRLDYQDKSKRLLEKTPEMIWRGSPNLGAASDLFTGVLFNNYGPPPGFCFDVLCSDDPIIDDVNSPDFNADKRIKEFIDYANDQAKHYKTNNIILTMGGDFTYQDAHMYYKNLDKLISHINALQKTGSNVNAFYSTPSCYLKSLNDANETWPTKTDDFFPYASDPHAFWTGYFTSRPTTKFFERQGNNLLQVCKQLATLTQNKDEVNPPDELKGLIALREAMGVMQHHDAITGTEKQHVTHDYVRLLTQAVNQCNDIVTDSLNKLLTSKSNSKQKLSLTQCALNISQCDVSERSEKFATVIYNPSSQSIDKYIRVPIVGKVNYSVKDPNGNNVETQVVPLPSGVLNLPGRFSLATQELVFLASNIPPFGYKTYYIQIEKIRSSHKSQRSFDKFMGNKEIKLSLNNGQITKIKTSETESKNFSQSYMYYEGAIGNNEVFENRSSGAYIFRPNNSAQSLDILEATLYKGPLVEELHQVINSWISNVVRVYQNTKHVEFDWVIGPIPINDGKGKEVISKFKTDLDTKGVFYTDSNGRELLRRQRNKRDTWDVQLLELIAGNYYPVTSRIVLTENKTNYRFTVVNDRAQGGSSIDDGDVELMIHRRLLHDDAFGVGEALNETEFDGKGLVVRGTHYVLSGQDSSITRAAEDRQFAAQNILAPIIYFANLDSVTREQFEENILRQFNGLSEEESSLPPNVQILTLEPWKNGTVLLRLEHILEKDEDPILSKPSCINIQDLFKTFKVVDVQETALGANQLLSEVNRLKWKSTFNDTLENNNENTFYNIGKEYTKFDATYNLDILNWKKLISTNQLDELLLSVNRNYKCTDSNSIFEITLEPMQIRTLILTVELK
ncbi:lysosomal alpha-mannosidase-like isoform X1 [Chrysoperla carnea]|uniref:lysosomal alpha-mannosidase-like isoform X1 n=1 Tax=Chrysoperla carnea TaxID=189513 RepID=UPI001D08F08A|nr:lysosomal alpha-mannosidase-like isoform X1 [Chrysoperla carnea]